MATVRTKSLLCNIVVACVNGILLLKQYYPALLMVALLYLFYSQLASIFMAHFDCEKHDYFMLVKFHILLYLGNSRLLLALRFT